MTRHNNDRTLYALEEPQYRTSVSFFVTCIGAQALIVDNSHLSGKGSAAAQEYTIEVCQYLNNDISDTNLIES